MTGADVDRWVHGYVDAWRAPGTEGLRELFTEDATYRTAPFEEPYEGLAEIRRIWEAGREGPDEAFTMSHHVIAVEGRAAVVRLDVTYLRPAGAHYRDLWVLAFAEDGRCVAFEEWPFWPRGHAGGFVPGPARD